MTLARDIDEDRTMQRLKDRVAVITGAARGIGRGIALCMAAEGADIVLNDLPPDAPGVVDARATAADIEAIGRRALVVYGDVADRDAVDQVFAAAIEQFGRVDIAVANAAFSIREPVVEAQWDHVLRTIEVTQFGVFHMHLQETFSDVVKTDKTGLSKTAHTRWMISAFANFLPGSTIFRLA